MCQNHEVALLLIVTDFNMKECILPRCMKVGPYDRTLAHKALCFSSFLHLTNDGNFWM
jgi:hypothetical protein